jgi:hypothetical protein
VLDVDAPDAPSAPDAPDAPSAPDAPDAPAPAPCMPSSLLCRFSLFLMFFSLFSCLAKPKEPVNARVASKPVVKPTRKMKQLHWSRVLLYKKETYVLLLFYFRFCFSASTVSFVLLLICLLSLFPFSRQQK